MRTGITMRIQRLAALVIALPLLCVLAATPAVAQESEGVTTFEKIGVVVAVDGSTLRVRTATFEGQGASRFYLPPKVAGNVRNTDGRRVTLRPGYIVSLVGDETVHGKTIEHARVVGEAERERLEEGQQ